MLLAHDISSHTQSANGKQTSVPRVDWLTYADRIIYWLNMPSKAPVHVVARLRPLQSGEESGGSCCRTASSIECEGNSFPFQRAHPESDTTSDVYSENFESLVSDWLGGSNATLFAFGQTGEVSSMPRSFSIADTECLG